MITTKTPISRISQFGWLFFDNKRSKQLENLLVLKNFGRTKIILRLATLLKKSSKKYFDAF